MGRVAIPSSRVGEALVAGLVGSAIAWLFLTELLRSPDAVGVCGAAIAGLNGVIGGYRKVYAWSRPRGWASWLLDSTWGLVGMGGALLLNVVNLSRQSGYVEQMSMRQNRLVYEKGFTFRPGFALAFGNVVSGAGGRAGLIGDSAASARRRRLIDRHEGTHIFQNRVLGPIYVVGYLAWMVLAGAVGLSVGLGLDPRRWASVVETFAYYNNPFEIWAYRRDDYWPPAGAHPRFVWARNR